MSNVDTILNSIVQSARAIDPALADTLILIANELQRQSLIIDPPPTTVKKSVIVSTERPKGVEVFTLELTRTSMIFRWEAPQQGFLLYELRAHSTTFSGGDRVVTTGNLEVILDPALIVGDERLGKVGDDVFTLMPINSFGNYATEEARIFVIIPPIGAPIVTPSVINNFIILNWLEPSTTFNINYYEVRRNGILIGPNIRTNFFPVQEQQGGNVTFGIKAFDIAGNEGAEAIINLVVTGPADFEIQDSIASTLGGNIIDGKIDDNGKLLVCINVTETFQQHFVNNAWNSPQDQLDDGFERFIQPALTSASYEEIFDFSIIFQNVIVNISYLTEIVDGSVAIALEISVSDDNISYSSPVSTPSFFVTSARYVKVKINFTGATNALLYFSELVTTLLVKREIDSGEADILAADAGGTVIPFNKAFKFVESITVTALSTNVRSTAYDFGGGVDPVSFKALAWDGANVRTNAHISWKARGVL